MGQAGPLIALVFQSLWIIADDGGTAPCDPEQIKGEMFVYWTDIGVPQIAEALRHLCVTKRITLYAVGDQPFARILNWDKHQSVHRPSKFRHPTKGQAVTWHGDALVPHDSGTDEALLPSHTPILLNPAAAEFEGIEVEEDDNGKTRDFELSAGEKEFLAAMPASKRNRWTLTLKGWREGMGTPGMRPFTPDEISAGLLEYLHKSDAPDFSPQHVVTFIAGIKARHKEPERAPGGSKSSRSFTDLAARRRA
jgi:hypothetical protein